MILAIELSGFLLFSIIMAYIKRNLNIIEIIAYVSLAFIIENEFLNVVVLNLELFKGINVRGKYMILCLLQLIAPLSMLWLLHFFYKIHSWISRTLLVCVGAILLTSAEFLIMKSKYIQIQYWPFWLSISHWLGLTLFLLVFSWFFRKLLYQTRMKL